MLGTRNPVQRKKRDEQGAVAPLVAILMVLVLVPLASLAIDIGYQRVAARDMQAVADVVAMDMARELDGKSTTGILGGSAWNAALANSLSRNDDHVVGGPLAIIPCPAILTANLSPGKICAVPGIYESGIFSRSGSAPATHVMVKTATSIDYFFPVIGEEDGGSVAREAIAEAPAGACFALGSYAARVRTGDSPLLGPLLGAIDSDLNLDVLDYSALANVNVGLLDLLSVDTSAGTINEVIEGDQMIGLSDFYVATAEVLAQDSGNAAAVGLLQSMAVNVPNTPIQLSDVLAVDTGGSSGLEGQLNVLDLVSAAAFAANGENAIVIPELAFEFGPVLVQAKAHITEPPKIGCGRKNEATSSTSQIGVTLEADADLELVELTIDGQVNVAPADGTLTDVGCNPNKSINVHVQDGLLTANIELEIKVPTLGVKGPIRLTGSRSTAGDAEKVILSDADYDTPVTIGSSSTGLPHLDVDASALRGPLGLPVGPVLQALLDPILDPVINTLIDLLDDEVINPLLSTLGVQVSGADVFALRTPKCGIPALRG